MKQFVLIKLVYLLKTKKICFLDSLKISYFYIKTNNLLIQILMISLNFII